MTITIRLAIRQWLARPLRPVLCSLAIAASVALIICVGAAMDSLRASVSHAIGRALGVAEIHVRPSQRDTDARLPQAMLDQIRALPEVDFAGARLSSPNIKAVLGTGDDHRVFDVVGIDEPLDEKLRPKNFAEGGPFAPDSSDEILIDGAVADVMHLKLGDHVAFTLQTDRPPRQVKIAGIIEHPRLELLSQPTVYVSLASMVHDLGIAPEYAVIDIKLKDTYLAGVSQGGGEPADPFEVYANKLQEKLGKSVEIAPGTNSKAQLADITRALRTFLMILTMLSAICASLIIGTTLSVGVQERVRQFGQLRCIGASRGQLATFLLGDAGVMLVIGEAAGCVLGVALSMILIAWFPNFFDEYQLSAASVALALLCGALATLLGAMIPIWQVVRVPPMAAVTAAARRARVSRVRLAFYVGAGFIVLQILLWLIPVSRDARIFVYAFAGVPLIFAGWCLLAPAVLLSVESIGGRVMGAIFRVQPSLLKNAWSRTPWRAGAMIAALMIGVTLFTAVRARGQSLMSSWVAPHIPDLVLKANLGGFSPKRIADLSRKYPELHDLAPFECFTVTMKEPGDAADALGELLGQDRTTFVAVNPSQFAHLVDLDYLQGDPKTAIQQLEDGRHVMVTDEFYNVRKLGAGDKIYLYSDGKPVEFTIAAVVTSTGIEFVKNYFDLRASYGEKAVASVLGSISDGKKYFKLGDPTLMVLNIDAAKANRKDIAALRENLSHELIYSLSSVELKHTLRDVIARIMNGLSVIGLGALGVASLGVANMVIASIHGRRYEFGVLRAIGAGRGQLIRLVLAEVTLIALIAGVLGAAAGLTFAYMATRVDMLLIGVATAFLDTHLLPAIYEGALLVLLAILLTSLLAWLASLAPAIRGAVSAQRTLLAAGRA